MQRPKLAEEIAASMAYKIGDCTLETDGTLRIPDAVDKKTIERLLTHLADKGFTGSTEQTKVRLIISMPKDSFTESALVNLQKLIENKSELLARAFVTDKLSLDISEDTVNFT